MASSGKFVEFYGRLVVDASDPGGPRDYRQTWRRNMVRHAASSRLTEETLRYHDASPGRSDADRVALVEALCEGPGHVARSRVTPEPGLHRYHSRPRSCPVLSRRLPGPKRPQDRVALSDVKKTGIASITEYRGAAPADMGAGTATRRRRGTDYTISRRPTWSLPRSPAAPIPRTRRCWSPRGWSRSNAPANAGSNAKPWVKTSLRTR